ncbi:CubicO group peptidase (beta-lactamase class C family) [Anaerosolibacter carboniphilus]|uniref:Beta-lactamase n=2 Tax=Anaerosolibacter carboniphilus TaxID=1417629 RepID=A0A841KYY3_9FIRM|nr:CubicO group peptidase (beta-lactamase class C family) [Anaerosolibacter carboniphilus]
MKMKSKIIVSTITLVMFGVAGVALLFNNSSKDRFETSQNNDASISSMIETYTKGKNDVKLTIGVLKSDKTNYKVFGADSKELEPVEYEYEIGSISKTFTAAMLCKAIADGQINLDDSISKYLPLDTDTFCPTIKSLATHTSGYGEYPFDSSTLSKEELEMIDSKFYEKRLNIYQGISREEMLDMIKSHVLKDKAYGWEYSNFGIAVLGTVLSEIYDTSFKLLAEDFIKNDLGLTETRLGNGTGNLSNYWTWNDDDTYFAAGGMVSTVTDLLKYGRIHLNDSPGYLALSHRTYQAFENDGFSMGLGWIIDPETGYLWHNGGTSSYKSFLGIDKEHKTAVVILSNYPSKDDEKDEDALDILGYALLDSLSNSDSDVFNVLE